MYGARAFLDMDDNTNNNTNSEFTSNKTPKEELSWNDYISNYIHNILSQIKRIWTHYIYKIYITHKKLVISGIIILLVILLLIYKYGKYIMDFIYKKKHNNTHKYS